MFTSKVLATALALGLVVGALFVLPLAAMTNDDLIKMKRADLSEDTILRAMDGQVAGYDVSPDGLIALKEAGLSEAVIVRALDAVAAASRTPLPAPASPAPASPAAAVGAAAAVDLFNEEFPSIAPPLVTPEVGGTYFTRFTLNYEHGRWLTTNYGRGAIVPINTPVRLLSMDDEEMLLLRTDTNEELKVENVEKYSRKTMPAFARLMLSAESTPLDRLPEALSSAIQNGEPRRGMTKEQVLMARGYPPAHETPSPDSDRWVFWSSRFVKQTLVFADGRLVDGRGID